MVTGAAGGGLTNSVAWLQAGRDIQQRFWSHHGTEATGNYNHNVSKQCEGVGMTAALAVLEIGAKMPEVRQANNNASPAVVARAEGMQQSGTQKS